MITCSLFTLQEKKVMKEIKSILKISSYPIQKHSQQASFPEIEKEKFQFQSFDTTFFFQRQ